MTIFCFASFNTLQTLHFLPVICPLWDYRYWSALLFKGAGFPQSPNTLKSGNKIIIIKKKNYAFKNKKEIELSVGKYTFFIAFLCSKILNLLDIAEWDFAHERQWWLIFEWIILLSQCFSMNNQFTNWAEWFFNISQMMHFLKQIHKPATITHLVSQWN